MPAWQFYLSALGLVSGGAIFGAWLVLSWDGWAQVRKSRVTGTRLDGGSDKLSASTGTKEHGTRTPGTGTTAGCSSYSLRGPALAGLDALMWRLPESSSTGLSLSTDAMATLGASGELRAPAGCDE